MNSFCTNVGITIFDTNLFYFFGNYISLEILFYNTSSFFDLSIKRSLGL